MFLLLSGWTIPVIIESIKSKISFNRLTKKMKKKLAIIGASYLQMPLVKKAKEMGLVVHCFAWEKGAVCKYEADFFYPISIVEKDEILKICMKQKIDGICTIASDVAAPTVAYVAEQMGLVGNSYESAVKASNKFLMRNAFMKVNLPCPQYEMVTSAVEARKTKWNYPLIVKPTDRSGSLGVTMVLKEEELVSAIDKALSVAFKHQAMMEEFIEGQEISVEFISFQGKHYPLQITDKVTTEAPHFVELEHHQPSSLSKEMYQKIYQITEKALDALGITNGASHSEYKITREGRIVIMEIGARMGGDFIGSSLVQLSTGYDFVKGVIEVALAEFHTPVLKDNYYSGVFFLSEENRYLKHRIENWKTIAGVVKAEITDTVIRPCECSGDRSGYLLYQVKNSAEKKKLIEHLKSANK